MYAGNDVLVPRVWYGMVISPQTRMYGIHTRQQYGARAGSAGRSGDTRSPPGAPRRAPRTHVLHSPSKRRHMASDSLVEAMADMAVESAEAAAEEAMVVNPNEVSGKIDYDKLIRDFGSQVYMHMH
eukprot:6197293-Pleurochrysis_carterae.AAC.4